MLDVNEAYTSKTRSWDGGIKSNLGGCQCHQGPKAGFGMDRDVNGARGIFLRALGDSPFLRELLTQTLHRNKLTQRRLFVSKNLSDLFQSPYVRGELCPTQSRNYSPGVESQEVV